MNKSDLLSGILNDKKKRNVALVGAAFALAIPLGFYLTSSDTSEASANLSAALESTESQEKQELNLQNILTNAKPPLLENGAQSVENSDAESQTQAMEKSSSGELFAASARAQNEPQNSTEARNRSLRGGDLLFTHAETASTPSDSVQSAPSEQFLSISDSQEEAIRRIARTQKPTDMIAFLNEIKSDFDFKGRDSFKYDSKLYHKGEKFLDFFEIESLTPNFIRFKDENYAYNLRFIKEN